MTPINWKEDPSKTSAQKNTEEAPSGIHPSNPWSGIALVLFGLIVGYLIAAYLR